MANPFYVQPAGDISQGLSGLSAVLADVGERKREREQQEAAEAARQQRELDMSRAFRSGDALTVAETAARYPEMSENIYRSMGAINDEQKEQTKDWMRTVLSSPERAPELLAERVADLRAVGNEQAAATAEKALMEMQQGPEAAQEVLNRLELGYGAVAGPGELQMYQAQREAANRPTPYTELAKVEADRRSGLLSDEQANLLMTQAAEGGGDRLADQRDRRIADYQRLFGMTPEEATQAVDSNVVTDPTSGVLSLFNPVTGEQKIIQPSIPESATRPNMPDPVQAQDLAFDPKEGTGFMASLAGLWNATGGQIPFIGQSLTARGPEEAAQNLRVLERDAIKALASSGRPPVVEQERIISMMPGAMEFLENPQVAEWKMTNFLDLMMNQYVDDLRFQDDLTNPRQLRESSRERANGIESIMRRVLTPEAAETAFQQINRIESEIGDMRNMPADELLSLDPSQMTDAQLDLYLQRLGEQ